MDGKDVAGGKIQYGGCKAVCKADESIGRKQHRGVVYGADPERADMTCCFCLKYRGSKRNGLVTSIVANVGIFVLLLAYTLLGTFMFLAIEGGAAKMHQKTLAATVYQKDGKKTGVIQNNTSNLTYQATAELRSQTVENIWEITVSLNILYKENWTRLAAQEIARYQDQLVQRVTSEMAQQYATANLNKHSALDPGTVNTGAVRLANDEYEWTFAKAFLYSLTILTTIGYGNVAPKTYLGKAVTMGYALVGIPLTLLYLSVVGSLLSKLTRSVCTRMFCCCICFNCGHCCYDHGLLPNEIRKNASKRQDHVDYSSQMISLQEPYYVRSPSGTIISAAQAHHAGVSSAKDKSFSFLKDCDSFTCENESKPSIHSLSILGPVLLCVALMACYVLLGSLILYQMENWSVLDGIFFCFMCLSTVGFGNLVPGGNSAYSGGDRDATVWFCSIYIVTGLALTAMCFNILHDEIIHRIHHQERIMRMKARNTVGGEMMSHHQS